MENSVQQFDRSNFDAYRQVDEHGIDRWSTRDLQEPLGYEKWENFHNVVIERAIISCTNVGQDTNYHFPEVGKGIIGGKGVQMVVKDYNVTKFGAFLIAMNGDPHKQEIAMAQAYFAIMTIIAEQNTILADLKKWQLSTKVVDAIVKAVQSRSVLDDKERAGYAAVLLQTLRRQIYHDTRSYEGTIEVLYGKGSLPDIKGDIAKMTAEIKNGQVIVQLQFPFDGAEKGA